ncbi:hypothetical protein [Kribbella sp. DT2]|uniref:hypothetical protein n=1 Tax=Kribbella sp. DT2 TaxID=3393427 RepID=UPI003CF9DA7A
MGRRRRGRGGRPPFQAWGLLLGVLVLWMAAEQYWSEALVIGAILGFYGTAVRLTRCRVGTTAHRPCGWIVRGIVGTCRYHVGYKRGLPRLVRGAGFAGLPTFMWPRDKFGGLVATRAEPQPRSPAVAMASAKERRSGYDRLMVVLAMGGFAVAVVGVVRDFVAG